MARARLIDPHELERMMRDAAPLTVLDVRWRLDRPDGRADYEAGHIPGAVYVSLDDELAAHGAPEDGRHPLPDIADLQTAARRWGVDTGDTVVVYDDWQTFGAARAWWVLTDAGVPDVRVLDGGLGAWRDAGLPFESGPVHAARGDVALTPGHLPRLDIDEAAALPASGILFDVRAPERYRGDVEPMDPRAGHIPGAVNAPTGGNVDERGRFLSPEQLRERYAALGVTDDTTVGVSCGSGVSAAQAAFALSLAGIDAALYGGSWSQWANHPDRPVATGDHP
ncbi:sulfurtransferase [Microbacterium oleivorans]|uniref:Thiosulfate sulfurtransferase n=1 Tax=Microbacterium oleivorans TaxID=273677 RepID=A0A177K6N3_9MICO|nr:sulfurtransferase [Microbacterium oleivorans]OAH49062.1 thiosulfate sulfurtransferase [Microbacterium oleivorans]